MLQVLHPKSIHAKFSASSYKTWQLYLLAFAAIVSCGLYLHIQLVEAAVRSIENTASSSKQIVLHGVQGVLIGFVAEYLYVQGDSYAKAVSRQFSTKDRILAVRIGVMTVLSVIITRSVPTLIEAHTEFLVVQTSGAIVALGILLVHKGSSNWNLRTEWPGVLAGILLAIGPSL